MNAIANKLNIQLFVSLFIILNKMENILNNRELFNLCYIIKVMQLK